MQTEKAKAIQSLRYAEHGALIGLMALALDRYCHGSAETVNEVITSGLVNHLPKIAAIPTGLCLAKAGWHGLRSLIGLDRKSKDYNLENSSEDEGGQNE